MPSTLHPPPFTTSASSPHLPSEVTRRKQNAIADEDPNNNSDDDDIASISSSSSTASLPTNWSWGPGAGSSFAPPFYNRPPTPLPPSPSLTSLLRPPFTPSRPTTPDSSDSEAVATSSRIAQSTPRASPKVPTYEYYGFVLYLVSSLAFLIYIIWSYSPAPLLHAVGIHYYPSRWWSLAIPSFLVMLVVYIFVALATYNMEYLTRGLDNIESVVDDAANIAAVDFTPRVATPIVIVPVAGEEDAVNSSSGQRRVVYEAKMSAKRSGRGRAESCSEKWKGTGVLPGTDADWKSLWGRGTDAVMDVPVGGVCEVLYGDAREREDWELGVGDEELYALVNASSDGDW
ncbi:PIG-P-domain-containing protein [Morchella snyderi]|nr:PIG-P-domain-containing protein [Morchella snyderi]